jgi:hypothetical protein
MVEGAGSDDYRLVKGMLYGRPDLMHRILDINAQAVTTYLNTQIDAGAQAVMIFDSWGGVLADGAFQRFSLDYTRRVVAGLKRQQDGQPVPVIVFTKGGGLWLDEIAACGADVVGLDWTVNLGRARAAVGARWRCKATSTPMCCSRRPKPSLARPWPCWTVSARRSAPTAAGTVMSSTSVTASASTRRPSMSRRWSRPFTPIRGVCATPVDGAWRSTAPSGEVRRDGRWRQMVAAR